MAFILRKSIENILLKGSGRFLVNDWELGVQSVWIEGKYTNHRKDQKWFHMNDELTSETWIVWAITNPKDLAKVSIFEQTAELMIEYLEVGEAVIHPTVGA